MPCLTGTRAYRNNAPAGCTFAACVMTASTRASASGWSRRWVSAVPWNTHHVSFAMSKDAASSTTTAPDGSGIGFVDLEQGWILDHEDLPTSIPWLNPTPHAIAVYASQPLSPVATQHSLPSGRYSLLGPDFHRLDRTSFAWRTHSITSSARARSVGGTVKPSAFAVLRLMTNSNFTDCMTGSSLGLSPLRMRPV